MFVSTTTMSLIALPWLDRERPGPPDIDERAAAHEGRKRRNLSGRLLPVEEIAQSRLDQFRHRPPLTRRLALELSHYRLVDVERRLHTEVHIAWMAVCLPPSALRPPSACAPQGTRAKSSDVQSSARSLHSRAFGRRRRRRLSLSPPRRWSGAGAIRARGSPRRAPSPRKTRPTPTASTKSPGSPARPMASRLRACSRPEPRSPATTAIRSTTSSGPRLRGSPCMASATRSPTEPTPIPSTEPISPSRTLTRSSPTRRTTAPANLTSLSPRRSSISAGGGARSPRLPP